MIKNKYEKGKINIAVYVFIIVGPGFLLREEHRSSKWVYFSIWSLCTLHVEGTRPGERQRSYRRQLRWDGRVCGQGVGSRAVGTLQQIQEEADVLMKHPEFSSCCG